MSEDGNGWEKAKELILYRLDELAMQNNEIKKLVQHLVERSATKDEVEELEKEFNQFKVRYAEDITRLNVKAGVWGGLAGLVPVVLTLAIGAIAYFVA
jgi:hypothetical protein